jgi:hypothetical protein
MQASLGPSTLPSFRIFFIPHSAFRAASSALNRRRSIGKDDLSLPFTVSLAKTFEPTAACTGLRTSAAE